MDKVRQIKSWTSTSRTCQNQILDRMSFGKVGLFFYSTHLLLVVDIWPKDHPQAFQLQPWHWTGSRHWNHWGHFMEVMKANTLRNDTAHWMKTWLARNCRLNCCHALPGTPVKAGSGWSQLNFSLSQIQPLVNKGLVPPGPERETQTGTEDLPTEEIHEKIIETQDDLTLETFEATETKRRHTSTRNENSKRKTNCWNSRTSWILASGWQMTHYCCNWGLLCHFKRRNWSSRRSKRRHWGETDGNQTEWTSAVENWTRISGRTCHRRNAKGNEKHEIVWCVLRSSDTTMFARGHWLSNWLQMGKKLEDCNLSQM